MTRHDTRVSSPPTDRTTRAPGHRRRYGEKSCGHQGFHV